jgi:hypothetical protein
MFATGPLHAMQFGTTLPRLLQRLSIVILGMARHCLPRFNLGDGYYRVPLAPHVALQLAVVIPNDIATAPPLIAIPLTLPMGWAQSPPFFCAFTETITDMVNHRLLPCPTTHPLLPYIQLKPSNLAPTNGSATIPPARHHLTLPKNRH